MHFHGPADLFELGLGGTSCRFRYVPHDKVLYKLRVDLIQQAIKPEIVPQYSERSYPGIHLAMDNESLHTN